LIIPNKNLGCNIWLNLKNKPLKKTILKILKNKTKKYCLETTTFNPSLVQIN